MIHASGTFEVKITPQKPDNPEAESANLGRMMTITINAGKHFYELDYTLPETH